jgi:hypothetical protein
LVVRARVRVGCEERRRGVCLRRRRWMGWDGMEVVGEEGEGKGEVNRSSQRG